MRMLMELHQPFDIIDSNQNLDKYKLIILPDQVLLNEKLTNSLKQYISKGGSLILSAFSGLDEDKKAFTLLKFGIRYIGEAPFAPDYIHLDSLLCRDIEEMDYCFYEQGCQVEAMGESEVLAQIRNPYFNRTHDKFCSHCQTPPGKMTEQPAIIKKGNIIYISKPIFKDYIVSGVKVYRDIIKNCMELLVPNALILADIPKSAEITLWQQDSRYVLHILNYIPQRKCREMEIVEEIIPLHNVDMAVRFDICPSKVYLAPQMTEITFNYENGYVKFTVDKILGHQMVVIE